MPTYRPKGPAVLFSAPAAVPGAGPPVVAPHSRSMGTVTFRRPSPAPAGSRPKPPARRSLPWRPPANTAGGTALIGANGGTLLLGNTSGSALGTNSTATQIVNAGATLGTVSTSNGGSTVTPLSVAGKLAPGGLVGAAGVRTTGTFTLG